MTNEEIVKQIQQGVITTENMGILYNQNRGYIHTIAKRFRGYEDIEDLMQEAYFGLYEAVKRYENTGEVLFMTYAGYWISQSMRRYIENKGNSLRLPVHLYGLMHKYKKVINAYGVQLGRRPTDKELCRYLKINLKQLENLKKNIYEYGRIGSLDEPINSSEDGELSVGQLVPDSVDIENQVINDIYEESLKNELWEIVKNNTTEEENKVIQDRFINKLSLRDTGESMGKSIERARQIEAKALRKLRRPKVTRRLREKFEVNEARAYRGSISSFKNDWSSIVESVAIRNIEIERMSLK